MAVFNRKRRPFAKRVARSARKPSLILRVAIPLSAFVALYYTLAIVGLFVFERTASERHHSTKQNGTKHNNATVLIATNESRQHPIHFHFPQTALNWPDVGATKTFKANISTAPHCPSYSTVDDLTSSEKHPRADHRHMVTPPDGGRLALVCCSTTKGPLSIAVHHKWAPIGAAHFLDMVTSGYFSSIPMMRCVENLFCQFGTSDSAQKNNVDYVRFQDTIQDDPQWLPRGRDHRLNENGVERFAQGYLTYKGYRPNSRDKQLILGIAPNKRMGGNLWDVPWGEVVGEHSFETISKFYTGYGEKLHPSQGSLEDKGLTDEKRKQWPLLDYIQECSVMDDRTVY